MVATAPYSFSQLGGNNGLFNATSTGLRQGTAYADPSTRYRLRAGLLSQNETIPMWGGVGVYAFVPGSSTGALTLPNYALGTIVGRATALTGTYTLAGFSVFDEAYGMVTSPFSTVPLIGSGGQVNWYPLGSLARIAVACDPDLIDLRGANINPQVSWDFTNQLLVPYASTTISSGTYPSAATISSGTYTSTTGAVSLTTNAAHGLVAGDAFTLSGMTGTGSFASLDGTFTAGAGTTGSTIDFTIATSLTLTITGGNLGTVGVSLTTAAPHGLQPGDTFEITSATGTNAATYLQGVTWTASQGTTGSTLNFLMNSGLTLTITGGNIVTGGLLPVKVLDVQATNCETVVYNSTTNTATWNYQGAAAIIQL
jgi:hypothetical protein